MHAMSQSTIGLVFAVCLVGCGGSDSPPPLGGVGPDPIPTRTLSITPSTSMLKINQTETFAATMTNGGQTQSVQPAWRSDNTTVLTFEPNGLARGRSNGTATIIASHEGLQDTRLIRVVNDYQGTWAGDYTVRRCDHSGDFRDNEFCDSDPREGFAAGEVLEIAFGLTQDRDDVTGNMALGLVSGTTGGKVDSNGGYGGTGSLTLSAAGVPVTFAVNPLQVHASGDRMTGTFTVTVTAAGLSGQGVLDGELRTVARTHAGTASFSRPARSYGSLRDLLRSMKRAR